MRNKKKYKADLEGKRVIFGQIGLILALLFVLGAFNYKSFAPFEKANFDLRSENVEEDIIPITVFKKPPPPPPPTSIQIMEVPDDTKEVEDIIIDVEVDQSTVIEELVDIPIEDEKIESDEPILYAEIQPEFPGGFSALSKYLANHIKYPIMAREAGISGTVYLNFIVEKNGAISNLKLLRSIGGGCDEEALRVVQDMPNWKPGIQNGLRVRVSFNLPVQFCLQ